MTLPDLWFLIIAFLWTGFFVLEGFDFGVGMLHKVVGRTDTEQRVAINSIGPFWDGNEVWLIVGARGHLRRVPGLVRHLVLGDVPAARAAPRGAHRPRGLVRVPRAHGRDAVAPDVVVEPDPRQPAAPAAPRRRARQPAGRSAGRLHRGVHGVGRRHDHGLRPARRAHPHRAVRPARGHVPRHAHHGPRAHPGPARRQRRARAGGPAPARLRRRHARRVRTPPRSAASCHRCSPSSRSSPPLCSSGRTGTAGPSRPRPWRSP